MQLKRTSLVPLFAAMIVYLGLAAANSRAELRVGAVATDVTPPRFPVLVNGGMLSRTADQTNTPIHARAIVMDDEVERIAIVVVDSCMMPRRLLDEAKQLAADRTKIKADRMLISATHTHSAPSCMGALGTDADPNYVSYLREKLAESIAAAEANLEPAEVGWAVAQADAFTALRRWIRRPDRLDVDPFGNRTVRANMHAANNWDDVIGESGPEDPDLAMISFRSLDGRPIACLANFSMHYFSDKPISADYFGQFAEGLKQQLDRSDTDQPPFVGILSHGCSGDIWRRDYRIPPDQRPNPEIQEYTTELMQIALASYRNIEYRADADLAMVETRLQLNYRVPDQQRLEWARCMLAEMGDRPPQDRTEVYAREQVLLHELQSTEVVVQALRIGEIGIATTPTETYALTGLKIKHQSPLERTMVIELANGGDGYIPPPEQHRLGGYNTWPARSAGLEVLAEPKITEAAVQLLEQVAAAPRRVFRQSRGTASRAIEQLDPLAYWRLDEWAGPRVRDASGHYRDAIYEAGVVYFLTGPHSSAFCRDETNRAAHFAGGRVRARFDDLKTDYAISLWFWNGMPLDARPTAGWMVSRGPDFGGGPHSEHLGLGGTAAPGRLVYQRGSGESSATTFVGTTSVPRWSWNHALLSRAGNFVEVYLNGQLEIEAEAGPDFPPNLNELFFGGRSDNHSNWEGRLDEIAVFGRALSKDEIAKLAATE